VDIDEEHLQKLMPSMKSLSRHHMLTEEFGGHSATELVVPYDRMLNSFAKEVIQVGEQNSENEKEASKMEKSHKEMSIVWSHLLTQTLKKTLSQRLTNCYAKAMRI
jgi:hypothetical protein